MERNRQNNLAIDYFFRLFSVSLVLSCLLLVYCGRWYGGEDDRDDDDRQ